MSGGSWGYLYSKVDDAADRLQESRDPLRRAFGVHVARVAAALKAVEWEDSGDGGDEAPAIRACLSPGVEVEAATAMLRKAIAAAEAVLARCVGDR